MKPSTKRILSLLVAAVLLIGVIVIYGALIQPAYQGVNVLRGTLASKSSLLEDQNRVITSVKDLLAQYRGTAALQDTISLALPSRESVSSAFQQLHALSQATGLTIQSFSVSTLALRQSPGQITLAKNIGTLQISFRAAGSYEALKEFLRGVETNIRVMDVVSARLEQAGNERQNVFVYNVVINAYYQSNE